MSPPPYPQRLQKKMEKYQHNTEMQTGKRQNVRSASKAVEFTLSGSQHGSVTQGHGCKHPTQFFIEIVTICLCPLVALPEHAFRKRHDRTFAMVHHTTGIGNGDNALPSQLPGISCRNVGGRGEETAFGGFHLGFDTNGIPHLWKCEFFWRYKAQFSSSVRKPDICCPYLLQHGGG